MRDIREDLKERMRAIEAERVAVREHLAALDSKLLGVEELYEDENKLWSKLDPDLVDQSKGTDAANGKSPFARFVLARLAEGPQTLDSLTITASSLDVPFGDKNPKRVLNSALMGLSNGDYVERDDDGRWKLKEKADGGISRIRLRHREPERPAG